LRSGGGMFRSCRAICRSDFSAGFKIENGSEQRCCDPFFFGVPDMFDNSAVEVRYTLGSEECSQGKGVHCEVESEGGLRQIPDPGRSVSAGGGGASECRSKVSRVLEAFFFKGGLARWKLLLWKKVRFYPFFNQKPQKN
jgi:hypothetical protein